MPDNVNHPGHYIHDGMECIVAIAGALGDNVNDYCRGNIIKYLWRYEKKNGVEDLEKARWYLNYMIDHVEKANGGN